ncbi:MAG: EAL domain-containing protein [Thioalkalispiraceae bacterium]|jgi:diguanylate cyclase (GGDEF)-like protein/PAS domain S-box-containing protein
MVVIVVLSISVSLQLAAVLVALRMMRTVGGRLVWLTLSAAILLMSIRRILSLADAIRDYPNPSNALDAELIALLISALILIAVINIRPLIESIKQSWKKLDEQTQRNQRILQTSPDGFLITDPTGIIQEANASFYKMINDQEGDVQGQNIGNLILHQEQHPRHDWLDVIINLDEVRFEDKLARRHLEPLDVAITAKHVESDGDGFIYIFVRDISVSKKAQLELAEQKQRIQVTLESIGDGVITTDIQGNIQYMNPVAESLVGYVLEEVTGQPVTDIVKLVDEQDPGEVINPVIDCMKNNKGCLLTDKTLLVLQGEDSHSVEVVVSPLRNEENSVIGSVMVIHNVTVLKSLAESLSYQATHDALTGLVNRREFESRLESALTSAKRHNKDHAMCYVDMDQFKLVNDTCGHVAGDELLKQVTQLLHGVVRETDTLARLGGDEFGILLESCSLDQARRVVDSIFDVIREYRFQWENRVFEIGISIGLVPVTSDSGNLTDVLSSADSACYVAKENGRNCAHVFVPNDKALLHRRGQMEWVQRIQHALQNDSFELYGQTIKPASEKFKDSHIEILLRMIDEQQNRVNPAEFMPAAERYHLMPGIDRWVVKEVFRCLSKSKRCHIEGAAMVNINLSGQSIGDEEFLPYVLELFEQYPVSGERICFEVTETAVISNITHARNFISVLKNYGCKFALDDFGSGLSSFQYLKDLDVDYLKIDGSFIQTMLYNINNYNMVVSINHIGHIMGLQTIAEFVENDDIRKMVEEVGVDFIQGYVIDNPHPVFRKESEAA